MQSLNLNASTKALLCATILIADPNKPGSEIFSAFPCDLDGKALASGVSPLPVYRDLYSGKLYVRIAETIPTQTDVVSAAAAKALTDQKPIHYVSDDGTLKGWFVEAPDYDASAKIAPAPAA